MVFEGPHFLRPMEIEHSPARLFYEKELFLAGTEMRYPVVSVIAKCSVLYIKDYQSCELCWVSCDRPLC